MKIEEKSGALVITDFDEIEAYKIAAAIEKEGISFYEKLAVQETRSAIGESIRSLITEEKEHLKFFESLRDEAKTRLEENEDEDLLASLDYGIFWPYIGLDNLNDTARAWELAAAVEQRCIEFYGKCRDQVSSAGTKQALGKIIDEESRHREAFSALLDECRSK